MKWIKISDKLPEIRQEVLAYIENKIYIGIFTAIETYNIDNFGCKNSYEKTITFEPEIWLSKNHCNQCEIPGKKCGDDDQCIDCCEKDHEIGMLIPSFKLQEITHWMPLPRNPEYYRVKEMVKASAKLPNLSDEEVGRILKEMKIRIEKEKNESDEMD